MSHTYILESGMNVNWCGHSFLIRAFEPDFAVLEHKNGQKKMCKPKELFQDYAAGKLKLEPKSAPVVYQPLSKREHIEQAELMNNYLYALDNEYNPRSRAVMKKVIQQVAKEQNYTAGQVPSDSKLYRWYSAWVENDRNVIPLIVKAKRRRKTQIDQRVFDLADQTIWDEYMQLNGPCRAQVFRTYQKHHRETYPELREISQSRFYELFEDLNPVEVTAAREGRDAARKFKRTALNNFVAEYMSERFEVDAVHLKVGVYEAETGVYIGCPIIYLAIDVYTRYIVGYSISYGNKGAESAAAVMSCLKHVAFPKPERSYLQNSWEFLGLPRYFVCDAGTAFRAKSVTSLIATMGCRHHTTETASPWKKPFIERFNRTLRDHFAKKLPGYVGRRVQGKEYDQSIEQMAKLTSAEFKEYLEIFIVDVYHQNPHRGLNGLSPAQVVADTQAQTCPVIHADASILTILGGEEIEGTIQPHTGIQKNNLHYQSAELRTLYNQLSSYESKGNPKILYLYDISDISTITVIVPETMEAIQVPCTHPHVESGLSLHEYKANKKAVMTGTYQVMARPEPANTAVSTPDTNSNARKANSSNTAQTGHTMHISGHQNPEDLNALIDSQTGRIANVHTDKSLKESDISPDPQKTKTQRKVSSVKRGITND